MIKFAGARMIAVVASSIVTLGCGLLTAAPASAAPLTTNPGHYGGHNNTITDACWNGIHSRTDLDSNLPNQALWCQIQDEASGWTYTGPIDGVMGTNSWIGWQHALNYYGYFHAAYTGTEDTATQKAMQLYAADKNAPSNYHYSGPIDGAMGPNSWHGVAGRIDLTWED